MRFRLASLVPTAIFSATLLLFSTPAHGQGPCPLRDQIEEQLEKIGVQEKILKLTGEASSWVFCDSIGEIDNGVYGLGFRGMRREAGMSVFFEVYETLPIHQAVIVAVVYDNGTYILGLVNEAFIATGKGDINGKWIFVQEKDVIETRKNFYQKLNEGIKKRKP